MVLLKRELEIADWWCLAARMDDVSASTGAKLGKQRFVKCCIQEYPIWCTETARMISESCLLRFLQQGWGYCCGDQGQAVGTWCHQGGCSAVPF
jgi:hypothetical protein